MGRPSRKRKLAPFVSESRSMEVPNLKASSYSTSCSLQCLVKQHDGHIPPDETVAGILHVWAPLHGDDVTSCPDLSSGDVEVDRFGVGWLVNRCPCLHAVANSPRPGSSMSTAQDATSVPLQTCFRDGASFEAELQQLKLGFEEIDRSIFHRIRSACNPAEALGSGPFLNRSAMKLANIDAISGVSDMPKARRRPLLFADLCGGPGGFSEYLLRRRRHMGLGARGWGISLRGRATAADTEDCRKDQTMSRGSDGPTEGCGTEVGDATETEPVRIPDECQMSAEGVDPREGDPCAWQLGRLSSWCELACLVGHGGRRSAAPNARSRAGQTLEKPAGGESGAQGAADTSNNASIRSKTASNGGHGVPARADVAGPEDTERGNGESAGADPGEDIAESVDRPRASLTTPCSQLTIDYGLDGTGDLTDMRNIDGFVDNALASTGGQRLDVVVADGGFLAARDAPHQEALVSALLHCEVPDRMWARRV